jgi:hypothetical protein
MPTPTLPPKCFIGDVELPVTSVSIDYGELTQDDPGDIFTLREPPTIQIDLPNDFDQRLVNLLAIHGVPEVSEEKPTLWRRFLNWLDKAFPETEYDGP